MPPPLPRASSRAGKFFLIILTGLSLSLAVTIIALAIFLRPVKSPAPAPTNTGWTASRFHPNAPLVATSLVLGADDFVVDIFHNGTRVPVEARKIISEVFGASAEQALVTVRAGDWLVFNVANNQLRWGGVYYFGAAGLDEGGALAFVSEENSNWSVCENPGDVPRFIADRDYLAQQPAQAVEKPWARGDGVMTSKVPGWNGRPIWGSPTNRVVWLKFRVPE